MAFGKPVAAAAAIGIGIGNSWAIGMTVAGIDVVVVVDDEDDAVDRCVVAVAEGIDGWPAAVDAPAVFVFVAGTTDR